jgi:hypothetical protein
MTAPSQRVTDISRALVDLLKVEQADLGLQDVWYGDQAKIPRSPAICVESATKSRSVVGAPRRTQVIFQCFLIVYHARVDDVQIVREEVDMFAEDIEAVIHRSENVTLGGLVTHGMITSSEFGYANKGGTLWQGVRMTYEAQSTVNLPMAEGYNQ